MSRRSLLPALAGIPAALVFLGAGCGGSGAGSPSAGSQTTDAAVAEASQTYRDQLAAIVGGPDQARRNFHDAPPGALTVPLARELARASRAAARDLDELKPPAGLDDLHRDLAEKYRRWAAALGRVLLRKRVSTARLGDVVREDGKAADDVYEQILIAP